MTQKIEVSIPLARLIKDQCVGEHSGHMASIPNNPLFHSIFYAITGEFNLSDLQFADTLEAIAAALRKQTPF